MNRGAFFTKEGDLHRKPVREESGVAEWAWIAGLFEGEGWITFYAQAGVQVGVCMVDRDVVERLNGLFPARAGVVKRAGQTAAWNDQWEWMLRDRDSVGRFLAGVLPWLLERRTLKALEALERLGGNRGSRSLRTHCPQGHPYAGDNLRISRNGERRCRRCNRDQNRRAYQQRRAA